MSRSHFDSPPLMKAMLTYGSELSGWDPLKRPLLKAAGAGQLEPNYYVINNPDYDNPMEDIVAWNPDIIIVRQYFPYKSCEDLYEAIISSLDKDVYFIFYMPRAYIEHERAFFSNISCSAFCLNTEQEQLLDKVSELLGVELPRGKPVK